MIERGESSRITTRFVFRAKRRRYFSSALHEEVKAATEGMRRKTKENGLESTRLDFRLGAKPQCLRILSEHD